MQGMKLLTMLVLVPAVLAAQQDPVERLREVLPATAADRVIAIVTQAQSSGLPGDAVANRALEALAKGKNAEAAGAAASSFAAQLVASRDALAQAGRVPDASEIEAGATALALGADGRDVSELAKSAPRDRSLAVPLAVIGALIGRELPSDQALATVLERLQARASNAELAALPGEAGRLIAEGYRPSEVGRVLAAVRSGMTIPGGPPLTVPANGGRPGRRPPPHPVAPVADSRP